MSAPRMTVEEWQKRLADTFKVSGVVGGHLQIVHDAEDNVSNCLVRTFCGQNALLESFQSFFIETLGLANNRILSCGWPQSAPNYPVLMAAFFNLFRRFRACEVLYLKGYPLDGYALMRDIKDRALLIAAVARNFTTFPKLLGVSAGQSSNRKDCLNNATRNRKDNDKRVMNAMIGARSGLKSDVQDNLRQWNDMFHREVHGGVLSLTQALEEIALGRALQIGPSTVRDAYVMYINRSSEIGWMVTRVLPYLQLEKHAFGQAWQSRRDILDDSFRYMLEEFESLGKRLGTSFITMMDDKFAFKQPFYYFEPDGNQMPGVQVDTST